MRKRPPTSRVADALANGTTGLRVTGYDGYASGPEDARTTISLNSPAVFAQLLRAPRGLGLARAWVNGQIDVTGDCYSLVREERQLRDPQLLRAVLATSLRLAPSLRPADLRATGPTGIEYRRHWPGRHTVKRDSAEVNFHYSLDPAFYRRILGTSLVYSGAVFRTANDTLDDAQQYKHRLICQKLGVQESSVVLDIGCGWGSFIRFAALNYGCQAIGITASQAQYDEARLLAARDAATNMSVIHGDYREVLPVTGITAATSIGMYEHVGQAKSQSFFRLIRSCLKPGAIYVNQAIVRRDDGPRRFRRNSFVQRYIFPNGQLLPLSLQLKHLSLAGFTVRAVERHGDSYALTIRRWISNLEANWFECARLEGEPRVRAWYFYLLGSLARFESKAIDLVQVTAEAR
jgi:cyclopropane-fatty-acyl-phospholipid synthase